MTVVDRLSKILDNRLSRRSFVVRSAFVGSALSTTGAGFLLRPGSAYAAVLCNCGSSACDCGSTCCAGYTEFCCVLDGGYNYCPSNTIMGGWWLAEGSIYCDGPRYYMDCNATCACTDGCGDGYQFCDPGCDGLTCKCAGGACDNYLTGCFQFRYGQCNQDVSCIGRIECRVVTCVPPWEIDPTCTRTVAEDDGTADQNAACLTPGPTPPPPPCPSPETQCEVVAFALSLSGDRYALATSFGRVLHYGGGDTGVTIDYDGVANVTAMATSPAAGYWLADAAGEVYAFNGAKLYAQHGSAVIGTRVVGMAANLGGTGYWLVNSVGHVIPHGQADNHGGTSTMHLADPIVAMSATVTGLGYWLVTSAGEVFPFGDAKFRGDTIHVKLNKPVVAMATTPNGKGYWLFTGDGGVFTFGDASYHGGEATHPLVYPIVAAAPTLTGKGYYQVSSAGDIYPFGDAVGRGAPA